MKFKVGDKVLINRSVISPNEAGTFEAEVLGEEFDGAYLRIQIDDNEEGVGGIVYSLPIYFIKEKPEFLSGGIVNIPDATETLVGPSEVRFKGGGSFGGYDYSSIRAKGSCIHDWEPTYQSMFSGEWLYNCKHCKIAKEKT